MNIIIDNRENELIRQCTFILESNPTMYKDISILVQCLPIGDIIIANKNEKVFDSENNNINIDNQKVIIERKSIADLAASIRDGRYEEQSYRLNGSHFHNHNIMYLVEGSLYGGFQIGKKERTIDKTSIYSAMVSLSYFKGFSVMRSINLDESALMICNMAYKINKTEKCAYYINQSCIHNDNCLKKTICDSEEPLISSSSSSSSSTHYSSVVKRVKKDNITPENIGEIMLSQIPGVSSAIAIEIMSQFSNHLPTLISKIKETNGECLNNMTMTTAKGQVRKINKSALASIQRFINV